MIIQFFTPKYLYFLGIKFISYKYTALMRIQCFFLSCFFFPKTMEYMRDALYN